MLITAFNKIAPQTSQSRVDLALFEELLETQEALFFHRHIGIANKL